MSRALVNNCFFFFVFFSYQTVFFKNDNWWVYGVKTVDQNASSEAALLDLKSIA